MLQKKIALGNNVDQRSKFSVKVSFITEPIKKKKWEGKITRWFISLLLTFFNIYQALQASQAVREALDH